MDRKEEGGAWVNWGKKMSLRRSRFSPDEAIRKRRETSKNVRVSTDKAAPPEKTLEDKSSYHREG